MSVIIPGDDVEQFNFVSGDIGVEREMPMDLGSYPYNCVGNLDLCSSTGFTLAFWIGVDDGHKNIPAQVHVIHVMF